MPYEHAPTAWQDPTHVRAMNENSWLYYTDWFWYLGWFEHRFAVHASTYLDAALKDCAREQAAFMKLVLTQDRDHAAGAHRRAHAAGRAARCPTTRCDASAVSRRGRRAGRTRPRRRATAIAA